MSDNGNNNSTQKQNYTILSVNNRSRRDHSTSSASKAVAVEVKRKRRVPIFVAPQSEIKPLANELNHDLGTPSVVDEAQEIFAESEVMGSEVTGPILASTPDLVTELPKSENVHSGFVKKTKTDEEEEESRKVGVKKSILKPKYEFGSRGGANKLSVQNLERLEEKGGRSFASLKRARDKMKRLRDSDSSKEKQVREVILPEYITIAELAARMAEKSTDVIKEFMKVGMIVTTNQTIDADTAEVIIGELGHRVKRVAEADVESILIDNSASDQSPPVKRPPVVTIMGHVDHGKTSLLDALRDSSITNNEAGGITQHIGAYQVQMGDDSITFIDTPGHEAFTEMRSRGAKATDIVILVVAADDGVKTQTIEAISHAKAAEVPIIVAVNKIDKEGADPSKAIAELLNYDVIPESMGGDVMVVEVSATKKINLDKLKETILLQAEMLELKAVSSGKAKGVVIESRIEPSKGVAVTVLVQKGSLRKGDIVVAGYGYGKVKTMMNDRGVLQDVVTPGMPVEITGLDLAPGSGDPFDVVDEERQARDICEYRLRKIKEKENVLQSKVSLEELFSRASKDNRVNTLPLLIKADVQGSIEAIIGSINKIDNKEIRIKILHKAVGAISESDVSLAKASGAIIIGFNVRANNNAKLLADKEGVDMRYYSIIYELMDDIRLIASGMLKPIQREQYLGKAEIRQVFNITKIGKIGGSFVTEGMIKRGAKVRLLRDNVIIHDGQLKTLKRFKDDVKEVAHGYECGIAFEHYEDIKEGDMLEVYEIIEEKQKL